MGTPSARTSTLEVLPVRIILFITIPAAAFLVLGIATSANLLLVLFGLGFWVVAGGYCIIPGIDRIIGLGPQRDISLILLMAVTWPAATVVVWATGVFDGLRSNAPQRSQLGEQYEAASFIALGIGLFGSGIFVLSWALPGSKIAALIFGPAFLGAAWLLLQRYQTRHNLWASQAPAGRASQGGHAREALMFITAIPGLAAIGIAILAVAL